MLAVVEHEQHLPRCQLRGDRVDEPTARKSAEIERLGDRVRDAGAFVDGLELDEDRPAGMRVLAAACELEREPGLAGAAGARKRQQACAAEERPQLRELVLAPDERARLERQAPSPRTTPRSSRICSSSPRTAARRPRSRSAQSS